MVSHDHKFIFIHINCCGGTSIETALKDFGYWQPHHIDQIHREHSPLWRQTQHLNAHEIKSFYKDEIWRNYLTFAFVRNPWARCATYYVTHKKINRAMSFKDFLKQDTHYDFKRMYSPAFNWLADENGKLMDIDFIGKAERLAMDFKTVCDRIGIPQLKLPHVNKSNRKPYWAFYDEEAREIVATRFKNDIDAFGYVFK